MLSTRRAGLGGGLRLLIIEDRKRIAGLIAEGLTPFGYQSDCAHLLSRADEMLGVTDYSAVVLDLGLPDGDGREWLLEHRSSGFTKPVLIVSARGTLVERIKGLDSGADDYLTKPFAIVELAARLRAILRRPGGRADALLKVGVIEFDPSTRLGTCNAERLNLSPREGALLELFMRRAGTVVTRSQIETAIYAYEQEVTPNAVDAMVSRLRRKLKTAGEGLKTLRGIGYMLDDSA